MGGYDLVMDDDWERKEIESFCRMKLPSSVRLALVINAAIETARRSGMDYEAIKKSFMEMAR
jgi:hypothetical protein